MTPRRSWPILAVLLALVAGLAGCEAVVTNGPMGDERLTVPAPWRTPPAARRSATKASSTHPDGSRCEEEGVTCEGDACRLTPPGR